MTSTQSLWSPVDVGAIRLPHRLAMAPMTRDRSTPDGVPAELNAEYYAQRASTAPIITEGTQPSGDGQGYLLTPGIHSEAQAAGWRRVTDAVHAAGGRIVIQLMHAGRVAHPANTPHGRQPVAPSALAASGQIFTAGGMREMPEPRALSTGEVRQTVADFTAAAAAAIRAGADGVEIHAANGYLLHQFLSSNANQREDRYGGSTGNRIRLAAEVAAAVAAEIGPERTGLQISPGNGFNDIAEADTPALYRALVTALAPLGLAYLNIAHQGDEELLAALRRLWPGALLLNRAGADIGRRAQDIADGIADAITVGRPVLANPDLVERVRTGAPLNEADPATFYSGGERGYTDYPALSGSSPAAGTRHPAGKGEATDKHARLEFNRKNIAEFRSAGGRIASFGDAPVLLLTTKGARSGLPRTSPMMYLADERNPNRVYVFASAAGRDANPAWFSNLLASPDDLTVEIGSAVASASAEVLDEPLRSQVFAEQAARYPGFASYQARTSRRIPVIALTLTAHAPQPGWPFQQAPA